MNKRQLSGWLILSSCLLMQFGYAKAEDIESSRQKIMPVATPTLHSSEPEQNTSEQDIEDIPIEQIQSFIETYQVIKANYVDKLSDQELFENAMHGLAEDLDPYSRYLDAEHYKQLVEFTEGQLAQPAFSLHYRPEQQRWYVQQVDSNSDAYRQGLRANQMLERINNVNIQMLDAHAIQSQITGAFGSVLSLRIKLGNKNKYLDVLRDKKLNYDVEPFLSDDRILVLKIKAFQQNTAAQVINALKLYQDRTNIRGLMLDLRDNPGGLLSAAVELADLFLEEGLIVTTKGRIEAPQKFQAMPSQHPILYPIAILQNRYSASAAEVFAAALQAHHRAIVLGETSYGKGAVQKIFPLKQGALQLTVSHYYTPGNKLIEGKGIEPDESLDMHNMLNEQQILTQALVIFNSHLPK